MNKTNQLPLEGQTSIVTGSSSGIGQAIAISLGKAGSNVCVNYHGDEDGAKETQTRINEAGAKCIIVKGDVGKPKDVANIFEKTTGAFGKIDILVNNAGIQQDKPLVEMSYEEWDKVIQTNLYGAFLSAQTAAKTFLSQNQDKNPAKCIGKIIFISSVHDIIPWGGRVNYSASKGGLKNLMRSMAQELAPKKIRINGVSPGAIKTPINEDQWKDEENKKALLKKIPYGRIGEPEEIGKVVVWLASDEADYITGTTIYVDGGMTLYPSFADD
jgi:glucose 1-dehydrogenase